MPQKFSKEEKQKAKRFDDHVQGKPRPEQTTAQKLQKARERIEPPPEPQPKK